MAQEKTLDIKFQKRFSKNLLSNTAYFILNLIIGLALVPFFLDTLGESAYGLIPLATSLTSYVTLFIDAVNEAVARYLTIDLQRGNPNKATQTYNTALFGTLAILIVMIPIGIGAALLSPVIFNIGTASVSDVFWLFALVIGSVLIRAWSSNFMVVLFAYNRLDLRNHVNNLNLVLQVIVVVLLFALIGPSLPFVGLSYLIAAVAALSLSIILSEKTCPFLKISISSFSFSHMREIIGTSIWMVLTKLGIVLRTQISLIIINVMFGTIAGTEYSLILTWNTLLVGLVGLVTSCFVPMIYSYRAKEDKAGIISFTSFSVKIVTLVTALLVGLVCIFAGQLMTIWVGDSYADLASLMWITVISCIFLVQSSCCAAINAAYIRVRAPAIMHIISGWLNIALAIALPVLFGMGLYGVAFATSITNFIIAGLFSPMYGSHILKLPLTTFIKPAVPGYIALVILLICGFLLTQFITVSGILQTFTAGGIIAIVYCTILWYFILNKKDRGLILSMLPSGMAEKLPAWIKKT